jgi:CysZ protein
MLSISDSRFEEFVAGFTSPLRALRLLLQHPRLLGLFILPMLITIVSLSLAIYAILTGVWTLLQSALTGWLGATGASWGAGALSLLTALLIGYFALSSLNVLIQLVASPFNDILAENTEKALGLASAEDGVLHLLSVFLIDIRKTALALTVGLLIWGTLPVLGLFSFIGMAFVQAFTFLSYPQSRRRMGLKHSLLWIIAHPGRSLGLGLASLILYSIPVLNLFALPVCVMAGTLTYLKK